MLVFYKIEADQIIVKSSSLIRYVRNSINPNPAETTTPKPNASTTPDWTQIIKRINELDRKMARIYRD
uniref:Uncharacterized protein n=1 Tax=Acrobeloides nanus TaxID=290746 RepID=A0A914BWG9_9BILA